MKIKEVTIAELQPTNALRQPSVDYLRSLPPKSLPLGERPSVWQTGIGMVIADGNNRCAVYAQAGIHTVQVNFFDVTNIPPKMLQTLDYLVTEAEKMRAMGVYSPRDLWSI